MKFKTKINERDSLINKVFENNSDGICLINNQDLKIFIFSNKLPCKSISKIEKSYLSNLKQKRKKEFMLSRSFTRLVLSKIFNKPALSIPLFAPPGKPPVLKREFGYISFSHCVDVLVIGWSTKEIGIDVEPINRNINRGIIKDKIFSEKELLFFSKLKKKEEISIKFLEYWVIKESLIKRDRASLFKNINKWEWVYNSEGAINLSTKNFVKVKKLIFEDWVIGIANNNLFF